MVGINGKFLESQDKPRPIPLPGDDPEALRILLSIIHLRVCDVPTMVEFDTLYQLSMLADKYDVIFLLRPYLCDWVISLEKTVCESGFENWLWIAGHFGMPKVFEATAKAMVPQIKKGKHSEEWYIKNGVSLGDIPSNIVERVLHIREDIVEKIIEDCARHLDLCLFEKSSFGHCSSFFFE